MPLNLLALTPVCRLYGGAHIRFRARKGEMDRARYRMPGPGMMTKVFLEDDPAAGVGSTLPRAPLRLATDGDHGPLPGLDPFRRLVGCSPAMCALREQIERL